MKIYVVTDGEYSDYHIVGVTDKLEKAVALCSILENNGGWGEDPQIETYDTDAMNVDYGKAKPYSVDMWEDGRIEAEELYGDGLDYERATDRDVHYCPSGYYKGNEYMVAVMARDEEHAKKIAIDLIAQYKYEKEVENK